jgi:hypothetical protein
MYINMMYTNINMNIRPSTSTMLRLHQSLYKQQYQQDDVCRLELVYVVKRGDHS